MAKRVAILFIGIPISVALSQTPINPYPNELDGMQFYAQYLSPLQPLQSDEKQVVKVLGTDEGPELKDWRIQIYFSCKEGYPACSHGTQNDLLYSIEVTPKHRVSLRNAKFPAAFSRSYGSKSEINVACDIYKDAFGLEYWVISKRSRSHHKGDLLTIVYGAPQPSR